METNNDYKRLYEDAKQYAQKRYDLLRLELLDKLSTILGIIVLLIVLLFLGFSALVYFSVALVELMSKVMPMSIACVILGAVMLIVAVIVYCLREKLFINKFIALLSGILFSEPSEENQNSEENQDTPTDKTAVNHATQQH